MQLHLFDPTNDWLINIDRDFLNYETLLLDFSSAFDAVDHDLIAAQTIDIGAVNTKSLEWFKSYLIGGERKYFVDRDLSLINIDIWNVVCCKRLFWVLYYATLWGWIYLNIRSLQ